MISLIFNSLKKLKYLKKEIIHILLFVVIIFESPTSNEIQPQNSFICSRHPSLTGRFFNGWLENSNSKMVS